MSIMGECKSTQTISYELGERLSWIRAQLVRLHHLGLVTPVAIQYHEDIGTNHSDGYFQNLVWELTPHARDHKDLVDGCHGCYLRELFISDEAVLE